MRYCACVSLGSSNGQNEKVEVATADLRGRSPEAEERKNRWLPLLGAFAEVPSAIFLYLVAAVPCATVVPSLISDSFCEMSDRTLT